MKLDSWLWPWIVRSILSSEAAKNLCTIINAQVEVRVRFTEVAVNNLFSPIFFLFCIHTFFYYNFSLFFLLLLLLLLYSPFL